MTLLSNEHGELYRPEDLEPPKRMKLRYGAGTREHKPSRADYPKPRKKQVGRRECPICGHPVTGRSDKKYCSPRCLEKARYQARKARKAKGD